MGCFQSNWHLLLLLLCYQTLGILAMGTTTPRIQLPKMQLIYGLDLQLDYSARRETFKPPKKTQSTLLIVCPKIKKPKKLTKFYRPFLCWEIAFFLS
jgi:hypothetical protein